MSSSWDEVHAVQQYAQDDLPSAHKKQSILSSSAPHSMAVLASPAHMGEYAALRRRQLAIETEERSWADADGDEGVDEDVNACHVSARVCAVHDGYAGPQSVSCPTAPQ